MSKKIVNTDKAPEPVGPYNQSVQAGNIIFLSGQIPLNPQTGELVTDSVEAETHQVMKNLEAVLDANGCTFDDVVSCCVRSEEHTSALQSRGHLVCRLL